MKKKRTYQSVGVQQVCAAELLPLVAAGCIVALDVAKQRFVAAIATLAGEVLKLFRFEHPLETRAFLHVVEELREGVASGQLKVAMEPTGTYGDAIRHQLVARRVPVWMVSPKRTHDSQELFDNVPSLHDPKSAVLIAKLCSMGLATEWQPPPADRVRLRALIELRELEERQREGCLGRLEALLARHWPEFGQWMDIREQKTSLRLLSEYTSPARVSADAVSTAKFMRAASRGRLSMELTAGVTSGAQTTLGVPMLPEEEQYVSALAERALEGRNREEELEDAMRELAKDDEVFSRLGKWMGTYTAAVIMTLVDPRQYSTARQLEKACGLNLREKSSGESVGRLSITKRGPSVTRKVLFLFALRMIQASPAVRSWYMARRSYTEDSKQRAVVAVMRKLVRAIFHVARGNDFDASKLFDLRRLELKGLDSNARKLTPRTTPRAPARGRGRRRANVEVLAT